MSTPDVKMRYRTSWHTWLVFFFLLFCIACDFLAPINIARISWQRQPDSVTQIYRRLTIDTYGRGLFFVPTIDLQISQEVYKGARYALGDQLEKEMGSVTFSPRNPPPDLVQSRLEGLMIPKSHEYTWQGELDSPDVSTWRLLPHEPELIIVPLLMVELLIIAVKWMRSLRRILQALRAPPPRHLCRNCKYDLRSEPNQESMLFPVCPECGTHTQPILRTPPHELHEKTNLPA